MFAKVERDLLQALLVLAQPVPIGHKDDNRNVNQAQHLAEWAVAGRPVLYHFSVRLLQDLLYRNISHEGLWRNADSGLFAGLMNQEFVFFPASRTHPATMTHGTT